MVNNEHLNHPKRASGSHLRFPSRARQVEGVRDLSSPQRRGSGPFTLEEADSLLSCDQKQHGGMQGSSGSVLYTTL